MRCAFDARSSRVRFSTKSQPVTPSGMPSATPVTATAERIAKRMRRRMKS